ncbi:MAG: ABC transporter ATP-binding protein [Erysipelotrichia bacterium]|nr:ABC transporter ATP-binding protein [Erysipelotrichia bacterium]
MSEEKRAVLEIRGLGIDFGGLTAVNNLDLDVYPNEIYGLIGPNGAGKTTVFNMLTKVYQPSRGTIALNGKDMAKLDPVQANMAGVARTFQNIRLFSNLSVIDNVKTGMYNQMNYNVFTAVLRLPKYYQIEKKADEEAMKLLKVFHLEQEADTPAGSLPYGQQRRLEIARALATQPKLLLLDEPAAGMNPQETEDLMKMITSIRDQFHISILLIEHDMKLVMGICERITVLNFGMTLAQGTPAEIQANPEVIKAYIGE